jgi:DNA replication and repair protein RecF
LTASACWLQSLRLRFFRNHAETRFSLNAGPVILTGANGSGKTNVLEAVSWLMPGRGLRNATIADCSPLSCPAQAWQIEASLAGSESVHILTRRLSMAGSDRRQVFLDEAEQPPAALENLLPQVWLTPKHDRLFSEGSTERRNYLDRIVYTFYPEHARHRQRYEHAWRERESVLEQSRPDRRWLGVLEEHVAREGVALAAARLDVTQRLDAACQERQGAFPKVRLSCEGAVEQSLLGKPALEVEEDFRKLLEANRTPGAPGVRAPHRSDWLAVHACKGAPARLGSTGEQKAVLLSISLAHARLLSGHHQRQPLLLLDEVVAHLDETKRQELFEEILASGCQAWLTGTDGGLFADLLPKAQGYSVDDGKVAPYG